MKGGFFVPSRILHEQEECCATGKKLSMIRKAFVRWRNFYD
ncbi:hypothetical protein BLGI_804 [Brevibacillus laterosporus GI-9]|nr:hypothetical protein BLGI_804 [Brevibacillus laterosporus GI-9]